MKLDLCFLLIFLLIYSKENKLGRSKNRGGTDPTRHQNINAKAGFYEQLTKKEIRNNKSFQKNLIDF